MHHALTVPEIIQLILSSGLGRSTIRAAALTCRLWKDPALDRLWRNLDSIFPLLWVLAPLRVQDTQGKKITWTLDVPFPLPEDWQRFETYARRVRTLTFDISPTRGNAFVQGAFQMLAQFRPAGKEMLPNLRKLTYNARQLPLPEALSSFLVFLSSSVVELELRQLTPGSMPSLLAYLVGRAPHVLDLKLAGSRSSEVDSNALATCLLRLEKLQFINTSIRLTPALWDAIAQHKGLTYASFASPTWGLPPTATGFQPREFARLERLVIRENFDFLCSLFESQNDLPKIIWVVFQGGCRGAGRNGFRRLCELLPQKFPNLEVVWLGCHSNAAQEDKALELGDFSPLMQRKNLRYFHLEHPCGVAVTESEFAQLLDAWPGITTLALQYASSNTDSRGIVYPINWTQPILPLSVLDIVAEKIPKVKELSLILDATAALGGAWKSDQHQFECLEKLTVSLSSISQPTPVASYLVQRSKKRFSLEYDPPLSLPGITLASLEEEKNKWDQVAQNLGLLYDQKERLEKEFRMQMQEERARHMRELKDVMDSSLALSRAE